MEVSKLPEPEILLLEKLEEIDKSLPPALWQQMKTDVLEAEVISSTEKSQVPAVRQRRKMFLSDFVNKAINVELNIFPDVSPETKRQLYRLHLFCCERAMHCPEVRHNPFCLAFQALGEMKTALVGMLTSYRLIEPSCPYSWSREYFEKIIFTDKNAEGAVVIRIPSIPADIVDKAVTEEMVTDWLIYRTYDNNGIKTLMDYKNNLITLPDYKRGGVPAAEFSRFERKMAEQRNREEKHKSQELDLEFRKTLVRSVAEQTAEQLINSGLSAAEILEKAMNGDINKLINQTPDNKMPNKPTKSTPDINNEIKKRLGAPAQSLPKPEEKRIAKPSTEDTTEVEAIIASFLLDE